eukprot:TRINITY_DN3895_c0_g1_i1.p1 TRINITY_DN3895_c0_g1~~TRINITY_DN3895_c0_g1_i1.p1  ORF type:complete len:276 (+),score=40.92 TRINITY_DN3895_c0_g1_i1:495-1322(+)
MYRCSLSSRHVARLFAAVEDAGCIFLLMELCALGSLEHVLRAQPSGYIEDERAACCAKDLFQGLVDIHSMGFMHRDIKMGNVLVTNGVDGPVVKLTDFGWAAAVQSRLTDLAGTFQTMAPEVLRGEPQTTAVDIWSAGAVIYQMVTGWPVVSPDFDTEATNSDPQQALRACKEHLLDQIIATCPPSEHSRPAHVSPRCWELLGQLLQPEAKARFSAVEALQHEWLQQPVARQWSVFPNSVCSETSATNMPGTPSTLVPGTPSTLSHSSSISPEAF